MFGFVDALRSAPFISVHFKRYKVKAMLWLTVVNELWVFEGKPKGAAHC
jgi:hypothetical protein